MKVRESSYFIQPKRNVTSSWR